MDSYIATAIIGSLLEIYISIAQVLSFLYRLNIRRGITITNARVYSATITA
jgi:hypothetical protein